MKIKISTVVDQEYRQVFAGFNRELFTRLNPPFPPVKLLRYDGSEVNDEVHLELNFLFRKEIWISRITEFEANESEIYFVDEGRQLPFFFRSWRHKHLVAGRDQQSVIIDDIAYDCKWPLLSFIIWPFIYLQFYYRKPIYRRCFSGTL